jgi:hypothetical protein
MMEESETFHEPETLEIIEVPVAAQESQESNVDTILTIGGAGLLVGLAMGVAGAIIEHRHRKRHSSEHQNP